MKKRNKTKAMNLRVIRKKVKALRHRTGLSTKALAKQLRVPQWCIELTEHDALILNKAGQLEPLLLPMKEFEPLIKALAHKPSLTHHSSDAAYASTPDGQKPPDAPEDIVCYLPVTLSASSLRDEACDLITGMRQSAFRLPVLPYTEQLTMDCFVLRMKIYYHCLIRLHKATEAMAAMQGVLHLLAEGIQ